MVGWIYNLPRYSSSATRAFINILFRHIRGEASSFFQPGAVNTSYQFWASVGSSNNITWVHTQTTRDRYRCFCPPEAGPDKTLSSQLEPYPDKT